MMQKKVLIVDDSKLMRIIIKKILSNDDLFVVTGEAGNGIEALSEIERDVPDIIFLEALKSDGVEISKKYDSLYEVKQSEMPADIQTMIDNNEMGAALLRIIEVIGPDKIENIDEDTVYFIINTLNQLNVDLIRNKLLLKVLPLKV